MESLEMSAKTVEEAIQLALERLGVSREEVEVTVLREGKAGLFGLGSEDALVRVTPLALASAARADMAGMATEVLEKMLSHLDIPATIKVGTGPTGEDGGAPVTLDIEGEDLGILIGRRGQTLAALQYLVRVIVAHQAKGPVSVSIDVEGYKQRRSESLQNLALRMGAQVTARRTPFTLEPMPAYERRIIHLALADSPDVTTYSVGEGDERKVVIAPKGEKR